MSSKQIKTELKAAFPTVKFSVTSSRGSAIRIKWVDGPTVGQVKEISGKFESVSRCEATHDILSGGNIFVFTERTYSESVLTTEVQKVLAKYSGNGLVDRLGNPATADDIRVSKYEYDGGTWDVHGSICVHFQNVANPWQDEVRDYVYKNLKDVSFCDVIKVEPVAEVEVIADEATAELTTTVSENNIKNGIEIKFSAKPDRAIISELKANGFRYSRGQNLWYAPRTDDRLIVANNLASIADSTPAIKSTPNDFSYLLGAATEQLSVELAEIRMEDIDSIPADRLDDAIATTRAQVLALLPADEVEEYLSISAEVVDDSECQDKITPIKIEKVEIMTTGIFPSVNKNCKIEEYLEQPQNEPSAVKITERIELSNADYDWFVSHLLCDLSWLKGKGGSGTTANIEGDFYDLTKFQQQEWSEKSYSMVLEVYAIDRPSIYVDPQGFSYARYVAFPVAVKAISAEVIDDSSLSVSDFKQAANNGKVINLMAFSRAIQRETVVEARSGWEVVSSFSVKPIVFDLPKIDDGSMLDRIMRLSC
jgi:Large polyvalent protein associated domain 29